MRRGKLQKQHLKGMQNLAAVKALPRLQEGAQAAKAKAVAKAKAKVEERAKGVVKEEAKERAKEKAKGKERAKAKAKARVLSLSRLHLKLLFLCAQCK
mmetsp:Transcript_38627/g.68190  ORF Transcript_38627/g.68190 Transcript_38627/m.68190 type:complete len:98 (-) Transcript_38627:592-885(-)